MEHSHPFLEHPVKEVQQAKNQNNSDWANETDEDPYHGPEEKSSSHFQSQSNAELPIIVIDR